MTIELKYPLALAVFSAPWCGPCQSLKPTLELLKAKGYKVEILDIEQNVELAQRFNVTTVPTLVKLALGQPMSVKTGTMTLSALERWMKE